MMNAQPLAPVEPGPASAVVPSSSVVVVTTVDGTLQHPQAGLSVDTRATLDVLTGHRVPVVLWSDRSPADVIGLQSELRLGHPFICRGGAALYVPTLYFPEPVGVGQEEGSWTVVDFSRSRQPRTHGSGDIGQATRLLVSLYRAYCDNALIIGIGSQWRDRDLLHEVDVPVVVRRDDCDQTRLVRRFPDAYVTSACGPAGWCEAILGANDET